MAVLSRFATPANIIDLAGDAQTALQDWWNGSMNRNTETAILGDPWTVLHDNNRSSYFNPLKVDAGSSAISKVIAWIAFPNRISVNFSAEPLLTQLGYAEGVHPDGSFGPPPSPPGGSNLPYRPVGPRGWQDEYCEWITTRNAAGDIERIDFTCENPEYWFSLWSFDPQRVLELYRELVSSSVQLSDLYLTDTQGRPVMDRATGRPAYNPTNRWNTQPSATGQTGAVHLISPPNTLGAEIYLAAAATLLRGSSSSPITDPTQLIACSRFGTPGRNSDPHIGAEVNRAVREGGAIATLQDPVGLYIQTPDFSGYILPADPRLPAGAKASDCWSVMRGHTRQTGDIMDFILHARFEIPQAWKNAGVSFGIGDISINGNKIAYGSQLTQTFQIGLCAQKGEATGYPAVYQPCPAPNPAPFPAPQAVQDLDLFLAGSTSPSITRVEQGTIVSNIVIQAQYANQSTKIRFTGPSDIVVSVTHFQEIADQDIQLFVVSLQVSPTAALGDRGLLLVSEDGTSGPAAPGMLQVVRDGSLAVGADLWHSAAAAPADPDLKNAVSQLKARSLYPRR